MNLKNWWDGTLEFLFDSRRHYGRLLKEKDSIIALQNERIGRLDKALYVAGNRLEEALEGEKKWAGIAANDVGELREAKERIAQIKLEIAVATDYIRQVDARNIYLADELGAHEREYCKLENKLKAANKKLAAYELPQKPAPKARKRKVVEE